MLLIAPIYDLLRIVTAADLQICEIPKVSKFTTGLASVVTTCKDESETQPEFALATNLNV